jgi:cinnamyl-alcohol dehydrogenase
VKHFNAGDYVGVGTYVDSCRDCKYCNESREIYYDKTVFPFGSVYKDGTTTLGGYSSHIIVYER